VEVGLLSQRGKSRTPVPAITAGHSLFPRSHTPSSDKSPCGFPALAQRCSGGRWGLPRSSVRRQRGGDPRMPIRLGSIFPGVAQWRCALFCDERNRRRAFWLWPDSRFGHSILTRVQSIVHVSYPCGTSLAPPPPSCWQIPTAPRGKRPPPKWETLSDGLHTQPLPAMHAIVGYC